MPSSQSNQLQPNNITLEKVKRSERLRPGDEIDKSDAAEKSISIQK